MDPLSLAASIIAVVGAANQVGKGLGRIIALKGVPDLILALNNEVSELRLLLEELDLLFVSHQRSKASQQRIQAGLLPNILRAKDKLRLLETLLEHRLKKADGNLDKVAWLRVEDKIRRIQKELRDTRLSITTALSVLDSSAISRLEATLENFQLVNEQGQAAMSQNLAHYTSSLEQAFFQMIELQKRNDARLGSIEAQIIPSIKHAAPADQGRIKDGRARGTSPSWPTEKTASFHPSGGFSALKMEVRRRRKCTPYCGCKCHIIKRLNTPRILQPVLGALFVGYSGLPRLTSKCTDDTCGGNSKGVLQLNYYFPQWMLARMLSTAIQFTQSIGPEFSIRTLNVRHEKDLIFTSAIEGDAATVHKLLCEGQASVLDIAHGTGHTALHLAVMRSHVDVVSILLQFGAEPLLENASQETPYDMAWNTILCFEGTANASTFSVPEIKDLFPSTSALEERRTFSRVHQVVFNHLPNDLEKEILRDISKIDLPDSDGRTALHWAAGRGDTKAVRTLLNHGANPNQADRIGQGPMRSAMKASDPECLKLLLNAGANVMQKDHWEQTCLQAAMYYNDPVVFGIPLIEAGIDVNAKDFTGTFALLEAVRMGHFDAVIMLVDRGADVNLFDQSGTTPFLAAVYNNNHIMVRTLLQTGLVDTSARDSIKQNVLHIAAAKSDVDMLMLLTDARLTGLDVNGVREDNMTASDVAERRRELELQEKIADGQVEVNGIWLMAYEKLLASVVADMGSPPPYKDEEDQFTEYYTDNWTDSPTSSVYVDAHQHMSLMIQSLTLNT